MLKRIDPADAMIGMYIHKLEGNWLNHPFWRARFLLTDREQLGKLRHADIPGVIIDTDKGCDLAGAELADEDGTIIEAGEDSLVSEPLPAATRRRQSLAPRSAAKEFGRAAQVADRGAKVVSKVFFAMRLGNAVEPEVVTPVIEDIFASVQRNAHAFNGLMRCKRDSEYIFRHALATSALMITLGRQMGLTPEEQHRAGLAGLLLDSGISLLPVDVNDFGGDPRRIPAPVWRDHVWLGHDFILGSKFGDDVARAALEHHERMDGAGYPAGTSGTEISLLGRMAAVCDTYDFLANDIAGGEGMDPATVLQTMLADTGAYDPDVLSAFVAAMGLYPVGSVVELASGKLAMVVDQGEGSSAPRLRTFYSTRLRQQVMQEDIAPGGNGDRIVGLADPAMVEGLDLAALRPKLLAAAFAAA